MLKDPLGVVEAGSVQDSNLDPIKLIYPDKGGREVFSVRASPEHKPDREGETYSVRASPGA